VSAQGVITVRPVPAGYPATTSRHSQLPHMINLKRMQEVTASPKAAPSLWFKTKIASPLLRLKTVIYQNPLDPRAPTACKKWICELIWAAFLPAGWHGIRRDLRTIRSVQYWGDACFLCPSRYNLRCTCRLPRTPSPAQPFHFCSNSGYENIVMWISVTRTVGFLIIVTALRNPYRFEKNHAMQWRLHFKHQRQSTL
jgi:hypothetical protein